MSLPPLLYAIYTIIGIVFSLYLLVTKNKKLFKIVKKFDHTYQLTGKEFAKVQNFVYEFTHGGTAAAQEVYFIYYLGLRITFE